MFKMSKQSNILEIVRARAQMLEQAQKIIKEKAELARARARP
jgi:hypothetical protein